MRLLIVKETIQAGFIHSKPRFDNLTKFKPAYS